MPSDRRSIRLGRGGGSVRRAIGIPIIAGAAAAGLALAGVLRSVAAEPLPPLEQIVGYFDSVALQDDRSIFGSEGTDPNPVSRWEVPILVHYAGTVPPALAARLDWHLERFRLIAGVEVRRVARRERANLRVMLTSPDMVSERSGSADTLCLTEYSPASGAIESADIFIPEGETVWLDNCMAHELMHAVGFFAHPKDNADRSVLEQGAPAHLRTFTALDVVGIRVLYDPRLRVGLARDRALPIARALVAEVAAGWADDAATPEPGDPLGSDGFAVVPIAAGSPDRRTAEPVAPLQ